MQLSGCTRSSNEGSKHRPCCRLQILPPCCSGRCSPQARSICAKLMAGRHSPQSPSISQLTSQPETIPSCDRRSRHAKFQPHRGRHRTLYGNLQIAILPSYDGGERAMEASARSVAATVFVLAAVLAYPAAPGAQAQLVSIVIVRHPETEPSRPAQPIIPLSSVGRQGAALLVHTLEDVKFTHMFASHTTRSREAIHRVGTQK